MTMKSDRTPLPHIDSLDPSSVMQNSTDTIKINGQNFPGNDDSFVLVEFPDPDRPREIKTLFLQATYISATQLELSLVLDVTAATGDKTIKVHNADNGDLSNGVTLVVE